VSTHRRRHHRASKNDPHRSRPESGKGPRTATAGPQSGPSDPALPREFDYSKLGLKGPKAEFEDLVQQKVAVAQRLGRTEDVEILLEALELGRQVLGAKCGGAA
jgi:hypothetical protein